jgi:hypothetical protein
MLDRPQSSAPLATEAEYTAAAQDAAERGDLPLALEQIAAAFSFDPESAAHRALLAFILTKTKNPLALLSPHGSVFFGTVALRARLLAERGELDRAVPLLLQVAAFRPAIPYLAWLHEWVETRGLRGVLVDEVCLRAQAVLQAARANEDRLACEPNVRALIALLEALSAERTPVVAQLEKVLLEANALVRLLEQDAEAELIMQLEQTLRSTLARAEMQGANSALRLRFRLDRAVPKPFIDSFVAALKTRGLNGELIVNDEPIASVQAHPKSD